MKPATAFEKRIKRRVLARRQTFFAAASPGLTQTCLREIKLLGDGIGQIRPVKGGIEFEAAISDGYAANLVLRTPSRILMRLLSFRAENFRTLEARTGEFEWELFLRPEARLNIEAATRKSRLYHTGAVAERARKIIAGHLKAAEEHEPSLSKNLQPGQGPEPTPVHTLFIRAENDRFQISLDSSGDLLHRRGLKTDVGQAPIRETIASAILVAAGFTPGTPLIDPMCGSGTFSLEAAMMTCHIPPGYFRRFAFENWPCFRRPQWEFLKRTAAEKIRNTGPATLFASDTDTARVTGLADTARRFGLDSVLETAVADFFSLTPQNLSPETGIVILNPPYGLRIGDRQKTPGLYTDIGKKLKADYKGWRAAVILPDRNLAGTLPFSPKLLPFFHGGLELTAAIGRI